MPKRSSSSKRLDANQLAASIVARATGTPKPHKKNPAAVELGRRGGLKGGRARAEALSPKERSEIAKRAANARWKDRE
jgi:hypothetical protein